MADGEPDPTETGTDGANDPATARKRARFGVKARLFLAFGVVAALTVAAGGVGWYSYTAVGSAVDAVDSKHVPRMANALTLARESAALSAAMPALANAGDQAERRATVAQLRTRARRLNERIGSLNTNGDTGEQLQKRREQLVAAVDALNTSVETRLQTTAKMESAVASVRENHDALLEAIEPKVATAETELKNGAAEASSESVETLNTLVEEDFGRLRDLLEVRANANRVLALLAQVPTVELSFSVNPIQKKLDKSVKKFKSNLKALPEDAPSIINVAAEKITDAAQGEESVPELHKKALDDDSVAGKRDRKLKEARRMHSTLTNNLVTLVDESEKAMAKKAKNVADTTSARISALMNEEVARLRNYLTLRGAANNAAGLLATAANVDRAEELKALEERFQDDANAVITAINGLGYGDETKEVRTHANALMALGQGEDSLFAMRRAQLAANREARTALQDAREASQALSRDVDGVVTRSREAVDAGTSTVEAAITQGRRLLAGIAVASLAIAGLVAWLYVGRHFGRRLDRLIAGTRQVAAGDLSADIHVGGRDEIAEMADALGVFRDGMAEAQEANRRAEQERERAAEERRKTMHELADTIENEIVSFVEYFDAKGNQLNEVADSMREVAHNARQKVRNVADSAETASSNVQSVSTASQQLTHSIQEVSDRITASSETAKNARGEAERATNQVQALAQAADQIGDVIQQIQDIAEKTNLLALNATIEAARAGEAGKGFAVVADEVKSLANQTQKATEDISQRITKVQTETSEAVNAIERITTSVKEIDETAASIASAMEEQTASTQEIARNIEAASDGVQEVTSTIGEVTQAADSAENTSQEVLTSAKDVNEQAQALSSKVSELLENIRAA